MKVKGRLSAVIDGLSLVAVVAAGVFLLWQRVASESPVGEPLPADIEVELESLPAIGSLAAPVVMLEFSDFHCPSCILYSKTTFPALQSTLIDTGRVRYAFVNAPSVRIHPEAGAVAKASLCLERQGLFWQGHDRLFGAGRRDEAPVEDVLTGLAMDRAAYQECVGSEWAEKRLVRHLVTANQAQIRGTPTFFVGRRIDASRVDWQKEIVGAHDVAAIAAVVRDVERARPRSARAE